MTTAAGQDQWAETAVSEVGLDPKSFLAKATFTLDPDIQLPADSAAKITFDGLIGPVLRPETPAQTPAAAAADPYPAGG